MVEPRSPPGMEHLGELWMSRMLPMLFSARKGVPNSLLLALPGVWAAGGVSAILGTDPALGVGGLLGVWVVDASVGVSGRLEDVASPLSKSCCCSSLSPSAGLTTNLPEFGRD